MIFQGFWDQGLPPPPKEIRMRRKLVKDLQRVEIKTTKPTTHSIPVPGAKEDIYDSKLLGKARWSAGKT